MFQNPLLSPLHAPLGLPITEEVPPTHIKIDTPAELREQFDVPASRPTIDQFNRNLNQFIGGVIVERGASEVKPIQRDSFDPEKEEKKVRLSRAFTSLAEPLKAMMEAIEHIEEEGGMERLESTPSVLDFFPDELQQRISQHPIKQGTLDNLVDLGSDSYYATKKTENVESSGAPVPAAAAPEPTPSSTTAESVEETPVVAPTTVVKATVTEGLSVAHSPCAYDLSGSVPWACYTTDTFTPMTPLDIRYHRVHICSPNLDKPLTQWSVVGPKQAPHLESPPDGSCAFKTSTHLSLRDKGPFILVESVEQSPLLMHFHGMSGSIFRYWRPRHSGSISDRPDHDQGEALGKFGQLIKLEPDQQLPRAFGGSTIKIDSHCCVLESSLIRAPLFPHKPHPTDFVLARYRQPKSGGQLTCTLRPIEHIYCMGQAEPLYRIDVPVVPRLHQALSSRVMVECRRFWLKAKAMPRMDFVNHIFIGERKSLLNRYLADSVRDIQQKPTAPLVSPITPEEAAVINGMKEGIRRLAERGIERIFAISPMRIANYVRDVEIFERTMPIESRTPRIAHYCVQLENEMRLSPWNLANDYWDVMVGKRSAMFQFSPLGDPSGGRGEGISFRKILKIDGVSAEGALSWLLNKPSSSQQHATASSSGPSLSMDVLKAKPKKELIAELQKMNVPERVWKTMSRWQLMRQLALLLGIEDDSEDRLAPWKRKALHTDRINDAWRKQMKALADPNPPRVSSLEFRKAVEAFGLTNSNLGIPVQDEEDTKSQDSGSGDDEKGLEQLMMDELMGEEDDMDIEPTKVEDNEIDEDAKELDLLRAGKSGRPLVPEEANENNAAVAVAVKPTITRLQIVSVGRAKSTGHPWSKVTYVYGEKNIAMYRKWKELEEEGFPNGHQQQGVQNTTNTPIPSSWQAKVEISLKVHRRFQRILRQAAEAGQPIPDVKRCGSCHLFGHDSSYEGCPMLVREMNESIDPVAPSSTAARKRKVDTNQSPVYD